MSAPMVSFAAPAPQEMEITKEKSGGTTQTRGSGYTMEPGSRFVFKEGSVRSRSR